MEYYRLKYLTYGIKASSREDAIKRGAEFIKDIGSERFVIDAEIARSKRSVLGRILFGD